MFSSPQEKDSDVGALRTLIGQDEKHVPFDVSTAEGTDYESLAIIQARITKSSLCNAILKTLFSTLDATQQQLIFSTLDSRIDDHGHLFVRFSKPKWTDHQQLVVIDGGNCIHCTLVLACYPQSRDRALHTAKEIFKRFSSIPPLGE